MQRQGALLLVGAGGIIGAATRYLISNALLGISGTLMVNVLGAFMLAVATTTLQTSRAQLFVMTGILSSFTTYSTFAAQTVAASPLIGILNIGSNYLLGITAAICGLLVGRRLA
ncbi:fluoride efflux transporter FluC [Haloquadratum walsbyi]|jgi:CrcB protein|uniref:Fluoride-specific ion channel FluC n=1 Tax=Haloquadratum walsbyi (strain DSM 16790 / HBSQ001) TaxID=362976 RepID=Q18FV0_HALWD|nr:CrcB family protein [Haloquadratum walsbyi]CAJ53155.1 putative fluoride ion transport protein CrcB [Haloquadratum walsbyi DSM 16790]